MFLYELAMALGQRSADVVEAAAALGMGQISAGDTLDAQQVAALRAHFALNPGTAAAMPGAPPPPLPAPTTGPLVAAPPGALGPAGPVAPPSWGPPVPPPSWGPPVPGAAAPAPPTPPAPTAPSGAPTFEAPPVAFVPGAPIAGGPTPTEGLPPSPPTFDGPPTLAGPIPPPPPPSGSPTGPAPEPAPLGPGGLTRQQLVLIAVVGVLVLGLFAFMVANTGPDEGRQKALKAQAEKVDKTLSTYVPSTIPGEVTTTTIDRYKPRNLQVMCATFPRIDDFLYQMALAARAYDLPTLQSLITRRRDAFRIDLATLTKAVPLDNVNDIEEFQVPYEQALDIVVGGRDATVLDTPVDGGSVFTVITSMGRLRAQVDYACK